MASTKYLNFVGQYIDGYMGTFSCNTMPDIAPQLQKQGFIVNLDPSYMPGSHWVSVFMRTYGGVVNCQYFDSFGHAVNHVIMDKLGWSCDDIVVNKTQVQHFSSQHCGLFALAHIIYNLLNDDIDGFTTIFDRNYLSNNDDIVTRYIVNNISLCKHYNYL